MKIFVSGLALISSSAFATGLVPSTKIDEAFKLVPVCTGVVGASDTTIVRQTSPDRIAVSSIGDIPSFDLDIQKNPIAATVRGETLFLLYSGKIQEWSLNDRKMTSEVATSSGQLDYRDGALAMAWHGDDLVIAHGRRGYSVYNTRTHETTMIRRVLDDQRPLESQLVAVVIQGDQAIFAVDNFTLETPNGSAFRGFLTIDLKTGSEVHRASGIDPGAETLFLSGNTLIVGYGISNQSYKLSEALTQKKVRLYRSLGKFGLSGHPIDQSTVIDDRVYTCFIEDRGPQLPKRAIPLIYDLAPYRL